MIVFESNPGKVIVLRDSAVQALARTINFASDNADAIRFQQQRAIITQASLSAQVSVQFTHALGGQIYIYVFGDRVGQVTLSGFAFSRQCLGSGNVGTAPDGTEGMWVWYRAQRASTRQQPIRLLIGTLPVDCFVIAFQESVVDAATALTQWTVSLALLPDPRPSATDKLPPASPETVADSLGATPVRSGGNLSSLPVPFSAAQTNALNDLTGSAVTISSTAAGTAASVLSDAVAASLPAPALGPLMIPIAAADNVLEAP